jgi:hypothetical protein
MSDSEKLDSINPTGQLSLEMRVIDQVTIIVGYSQLLQRRGVVGREYLHQCLSQITRSAEHIGELVHQMAALRKEPEQQ